MKRALSSLAIVMVCAVSCIGQINCPIIPTPSVYEMHDGVYQLKDQVLLNTIEADLQSSRYLVGQLQEVFGIETKFYTIGYETGFHRRSGIDFKRDSSVSENGYSLDVQPDAVTIKFSNSAGCFAGVNSLLQLISTKKTIPLCHIQDQPKFSWRGLHLDVSRHFYSVEEIKRFIDLMAMYKFNTFHWHLTDDQGWRLEIKKYPKLTEIGAYRDSTIIGHYSTSPRKYKVERYGGFYTQQEAREIVEYAADRYITVVPEIEMPGHSRAAIAAYPELSCKGDKLAVPGLWGVFEDIYCSKESTIDFMKDVLEEVLSIFPSEYIHIGGDEAPKYRWKECSNCQKVISENNLKDEHELQSYFIKQIDDFLTSENRKLIGWDEILEGGLSPNAAVMSWRGEKGGIEAAKQEHQVVMSPTTYCYFDYYQSDHPSEPTAIGGYLPLEKVYKFNPIPDDLTEEEGKYVLGGQANLWTEYITSMDHLEYMTYPRALALIQSLWCENKPDYDSFLTVYQKYQMDVLDRYKVNYSNSIYLPKLVTTSTPGGINISLESAAPNSIYTVKLNFSEGEFKSVDLKGSDKLFIPASSKPGAHVDIQVMMDEVKGVIAHRLNQQPLLGKEIKLLTEPHEKYNNKGAFNLTDGIKGSTPWKGGEWLGFNQGKAEFIVPIENVKNFEGLRIGFLESHGSWIYKPNKVLYYESKDGLKWTEVKKIRRMKGMHGAYDGFKLKGSYVKVKCIGMNEIPQGNEGAGHMPWIFIDEVELIEKQ